MSERGYQSDGGAVALAHSGLAGRIVRLIRKELNEILRDRRTMLTLILMPLLLYPLLSVAFQQFLMSGQPLTPEKPDALRIGFVNSADETLFSTLLIEASRKAIPYPLPEPKNLFGVANPDLDALKEMLIAREIDVIVVGHAPRDKANAVKRLEWDLFYLKGSYRSEKVLHQLGEALAGITAFELAEKLPNSPRRDVVVLAAEGKPIDRPPQPSGFPLGSLVPLILILMTITGAVYPAIDLTAGERERGTLEILVAAPVPRLGLLFAKYVAVFTVAMLTGLVNLLSMSLTLLVTGLGSMLFGEQGLTPLLILEIFGLLLLLAAFFSAVLLTLTSFARSFKEAQAYLIPLMLLSLAPGLAGIVPGVELSPLLSFVPLLNAVLLGRDLFADKADPMLAAIVVGSTLLYATAAIAVAARIFGSEDVLYSNQSGWAELFRRPHRVRPAASVSSALFCLCLLFTLFFLSQGAIRVWLPPDLSRPDSILPHLLFVPLMSLLLFVAIPIGLALLRRVQPSSGFALRVPAVRGVIAATVLGLSLWPWVLEMLVFLQKNGWTTVSQEQRERIVEPIRQLQQELPLWVMLVVTVIPALAEELFFRGFLFAAVLRKSSPRFTIVLCAILFGVFHVATETFGLERLLPSTLMGLVLGWVRWRTGSVWPAMLLHGCHNGMLTWIGHQQAHQPAGDSPDLPYLPWPWLAASAVAAVVGVLLLVLLPRRSDGSTASRLGSDEPMRTGTSVL